MAMVTPIGVSLNAFDGNNPQVFSFIVNGGNQVVKNKIIIVDFDNESTIYYQNTVESYSFSQIVPSETLGNGHHYKYSFITYDSYNNESEPSEYVDFWCFTTPTVRITNIDPNTTVDESSYLFEAIYEQIENEPIDTLRFVLYNDSNEIISTSPNYTSNENSPINFSHQFTGFENDKTYKIGISGVTLYGTVFQSHSIPFDVRYTPPEEFSNIEVLNLCDEGYNQIRSNLRILHGSTNHTPKYIDNEKLDLLDIMLNKKAFWRDDAGIITSDFVMQLWFGVGILGKIFKISNDLDSSNIVYFEGSLLREVPPNGIYTQDYVEVKGYVNNHRVFYMKSNYIELTNNTANLVLYFKYNPTNNKYELALYDYDKVDNYFTMGVYELMNIVTQDDDDIITNDGRLIGADVYAHPHTNIEYNRLTNIRWNNLTTQYSPSNPIVSTFGDMTVGYPFNLIELYNGIFDGIYITSDISMEYQRYIPDWNYLTDMRCVFQNNLEAGNIDIDLSSIEYFRIKSRQKGTFNWITIYEKWFDGGNQGSVKFTVNDYIAPSGVIMEYAFIPVYYNGIEGAYIITEKETVWSRLFVTDASGDTLSLVGNVQLGNLTSNTAFGTLQPISRKYPIVINNSQIDYDSGTISGAILSDNINESLTHSVRRKIVEKREKWDAILKNGKAKIIKDWNGFIWLCCIASAPNYSTSQTMANGYGSISFTFVEQGKWNNAQDLYKYGFIANA